MNEKKTGYPSIDQPWLKYYEGKQNKPIPHTCIYEIIKNENADYMDGIALNYFGRKYTFQELFDGADAAANAFKAAGLKAGDVVVFFLVNTPESVFAYLGANKMGLCVNQCDLRSDVKTMKHYISQVSPKVIVTLDMCWSTVVAATEDMDCVEKIVTLSVSNSMPQPILTGYKLAKEKKIVPTPVVYSDRVISWNDFIAAGEGIVAEQAPYDPDFCSIMMHTGGTTGLPKTVMLSDETIIGCLWGLWVSGINFARGDVWYNELPPFIVYGLTIAIICPLAAGMTVVLNPNFDPKAFPMQVLKYRPQHVAAVTEHFRQLYRSPLSRYLNYKFAKTFIIGGDAVPVDEEKRLNKFLKLRHSKMKIIKGYGMTELSPLATLCTPEVNAIGSIGIPLYSSNIKIVDTDTLEERPYNKIGEIWVSSPGIMLGYLGDEEATNEMIVTDKDGTRWLRTSDLGYMTEEGLLYHKGRMRRIYMTVHDGQGAKIFPAVPEDAIRTSKDVMDTAVACRPMRNSTFYEPVAFVVKEPASHKTDEELTEELKQINKDSVPSYMRPVKYVYLDNLPLTVAGKVDFVKLEKMAVKA